MKKTWKTDGHLKLLFEASVMKKASVFSLWLVGWTPLNVYNSSNGSAQWFIFLAHEFHASPWDANKTISHFRCIS